MRTIPDHSGTRDRGRRRGYPEVMYLPSYVPDILAPTSAMSF